MNNDGRMLKADGHLSDDWLLLAIDGELSFAHHAQVKEHIRACWSCRARREQLEKTIKDIVDYEHALVAPDMPPSPGGKAIFMARLNQLSDELGSPFSMPGWVMTLLHGGRSLLASRAAWAVSTTFVLGSVLYFVFARPTQVVSASQLLQRIETSNATSLAGVKQPVTIQKLSIKTGGRKLTRTLYSDALHKRQAHRVDTNASDEELVARVFARSTFNWNDPMSARMFRQWRDGLSQRKDVVTELTGGFLRLDTSTVSGPVAEASLTVRENDYHPIAEDLRLRDNTQIEIAELSYDVVGLPSLPTAIFANSLRAPGVPSLPSLRVAVPDSHQIAASEIQVRSILHRLGADLGEQISVRPLSDGLIHVEGMTDGEVRRQQLESALRAVPHTRVRLITVAQAAAHARPEHSLAAANSITLVAARPALLEEQLEKRFPGTDQRREYVNQALSLCQSASARAWALNRLADRYTPQQVAWLDPDAQRQLQSLLGDHISALREDISRLQNQLGQVLSSASNTVAANTDTSSGINNQSDDWRSRVHRAHSSVEITNETVSALLTGSSDSSDSPDKLQLRLRTTLTQLQAELPLLDQQIHKQL